MLIPQFKITQDDDYVIVSIRLPYVKVTACEFYIDEKLFKFYLKPYLLSLSFEQPLKPSQEPSKAVYNHDKHILTVYLEKLNKKQYFENLNLLSNILQNKKTQKQQKNKEKRTLIEVMDEKGQKVIETQQNQLTKNQYAYGFGANYHNVFKNLQDQVLQLFLFDPKDVSISERFELSKKIAYEQFDEDGYLFDKMSNFEEIDRIIESNEARDALIKLVKEYHGVNDVIDYEKFKSQLKIPNKEILIAKGDQQNVWKQLIAIVFSYLYELICMEGEFGVESAKTISKTCAVFSSNVLYREQSLQQVIYDCSRHCITYSLYKHIDICQKVLQLMKKQLSLNLLTAILSDLRFTFQKSDPKYLLNTIYLNDYCVYIMTGPAEDKERKIKQLMEEVSKIKLQEHGLELDVEGEQEEQEESMQKNDSLYLEEGQIKSKNELEMLLDLD